MTSVGPWRNYAGARLIPMAADPRYADYCCELLSTVGPCRARRMFGGWGISTDGMTIAIVADTGEGDKLWLKGDEATRPLYEGAGCVRFTYVKQGEKRGFNYFSPPEDALES